MILPGTEVEKDLDATFILCFRQKQTTVRNKQCRMPISPSEYFRQELNQPSPRGLPLVEDQGMPFHPRRSQRQRRGQRHCVLQISCCVRPRRRVLERVCDGR